VPPDFFIVGHPKCGTTALYEMLKAHPQVFMPALKEPHFFARESHERGRPSRRLPTTLEQYLALFAGARAGQRTGEASTSYLRSPAAAARIAELCTDAQIVAILREPAGFLRSLHLQLLQSGVETEPDLATAMGLEEARRSAAAGERGSFWRQALLYSQQVRYVEQLRSYAQRFGRERLLVLVYDDFRADNERTARDVLRFIGVDDTVALEHAQANPTVRVRDSKASEAVRAVTIGRGPLARETKALVKSVVPRPVRRGAVRTLTRTLVKRKPPPADEVLMAELRRRFTGQVQAASEYLQRDLVSLWGYDASHT